MAERIFSKPKGDKRGFIRIKCPDCSNEQYVFMRPSSEVTCNVCGSVIAKPTGGKLAAGGEIVPE